MLHVLLTFIGYLFDAEPTYTCIKFVGFSSCHLRLDWVGYQVPHLSFTYLKLDSANNEAVKLVIWKPMRIVIKIFTIWRGQSALNNDSSLSQGLGHGLLVLPFESKYSKMNDLSLFEYIEQQCSVMNSFCYVTCGTLSLSILCTYAGLFQIAIIFSNSFWYGRRHNFLYYHKQPSSYENHCIGWFMKKRKNCTGTHCSSIFW